MKNCTDCEHPLDMHKRHTNGAYRCTSSGCGCEVATVESGVTKEYHARFWVDVVISTNAGHDEAVRIAKKTQHNINLTGGIPLPVRDETFEVQFERFITIKEAS